MTQRIVIEGTAALDLINAVQAARDAAEGDSNDAEIEAWQEVGDLIEAAL